MGNPRALRASARQIYATLAAAGWACELLTGDVPQLERAKMVERFRAAGKGGGEEDDVAKPPAFVFTSGEEAVCLQAIQPL